MAFFLWSSASGWGLISMAIWCSLSGVLSFTDLSSCKPFTFLTQHLLPKELELTELPICCYKPWENTPFRSPAMSGILNWHLSYSTLGPPLHLSYGHIPAGCSQMVLSRGKLLLKSDWLRTSQQPDQTFLKLCRVWDSSYLILLPCPLSFTGAGDFAGLLSFIFYKRVPNTSLLLPGETEPTQVVSGTWLPN